MIKMKITKYPQSCLLIETKGKKILIDPGTLKYKEEYFNVWNNVDVILITHKHSDHCNVEVLEKINKDIKIYSSKEVENNYPSLTIEKVKENDIINISNEIKVEVVHAEHGYIPPMKTGARVNENIGFIIDDNSTRVYVTSDTICFQNDYKCDIICLPVSDYGVVMGAFEASLFAKEADAKLVIPLHADNPKFPVNFEFVKEMFEKNEVEYEILESEEYIEIE
ncbi:MAG: MBL fold metallo-hydrolase [Clostridia bacterium]|nr:MBL fold metallo-hydrolase [Clostridia bacterium]